MRKNRKSEEPWLAHGGFQDFCSLLSISPSSAPPTVALVVECGRQWLGIFLLFFLGRERRSDREGENEQFRKN
jgi:hypothetical protein